MASRRQRSAASLIAAVLCATVALGPTGDAAHAATRASRSPEAQTSTPDWLWPLARSRLEREFQAPAHRYGAGHRGIDLRADPGAAIRAPAPGIVAFAGRVAGRGVLTIDHGAGLVTTLEPVETRLAPGTAVDRGDSVAALSVGGHSAPGALHFGVRLDGEYINPLLLLGAVPRAVLLPCC